MADLFGKTNTPEWMSPGIFSLESEKASESIGRNFSQAFNAAASRMQEQNQFDAMMPLRIQEANLKAQETQVDIAGKMIENQNKSDLASDRLTFQAAQSSWMKGDSAIAPQFKSPATQSIWENWKADTTLGKSIADQNALFKQKTAALDGPGIDAVLKLKGNNPLPSSAAWAKLGEEEKRVQADKMAARVAPPSEISKMLTEQKAAIARGDSEAADALGAALGNRTKPTAPTGEQSNALIYADRMKSNDQIIHDLEGKGFDPAGVGAAVWRPNIFKGEDLQSYEAAKKNWVTAVLRKESGAAIAQSEFKGADEQYFPQFGDAPKVVQQKAQLRSQVEDNMRRAAGNQATPTAKSQPVKQFQTEDEARKAGGKPGDIVEIYDQATARYRKARLK